MEEVKKYVLTGGPSSGKSTTIEDLRKRGYSVLDEVAREMIKQRESYPNTKRGICEFQEMMFNEQLKRERSLDGKLAFLDRGLGDYYAYSEHLVGYVPEGMRDFDIRGRYDALFVLDRLPFVDDGLRIESGEEEAEKLHRKLIDAYVGCGYNPVFVPILPVKERTEFILDYLGVRK